MEPHDFDIGLDAWPSQAPPSDFADRCVSAMLEEPAPKSHRRWLGKGTLFFLAAALCGSSAWATGQARASAQPAEVARFVPVMPMPEPRPQTEGQVVELTPVTPEPEVDEPPPAPPVRRARPPAPEPEVEEPTPPPPPPFVMVPRCACDQDVVVCSCY